MAITYKGVNYADTAASPITQIEGAQYNVKELHILDQFVFTADLAANDTILMGGPIPEGAVLLDCRIVTGALGGSAAINVGYQAGAVALAGALAAQAVDLTAFFSALPVSSATYASAFGSTYIGDFYTQAALTSQVQPAITCSVATSGATGKSIYIDISYVKNGG
jgi:hypothetical protein